jgi:hypothetical protein
MVLARHLVLREENQVDHRDLREKGASPADHDPRIH